MWIMSTLGEKLRRLRERKGVSQTVLGEAVSKTRDAVAGWERGRAEPSMDDLKAIADYFEVSTDYLLGRTPARAGVNEPAAELYQVDGQRAVPVIGTIPAGMPLLAVEDESEKMMLPEELLRGKEHVFLLRVKGDSMQDEGIRDGDLVLINKDDQVRDMDIGAVLIDEEEVTLKKVHFYDGYVSLIPANNEYMPSTHRADAVRILGRMDAQWRKR